MKILLLIFLSTIAWQPLTSQWINIKEKGADAEGKLICTTVINNTIDSLAAKGGGTVYFPSGRYLTGPVIFKSNITLYLDAGATIVFSDDFDDYLPMVKTRWEDIRVLNFCPQFYAYQCENIAIKGDGHVDGNGKKWWDFWNQVRTGAPTDTKWQMIFREQNAELLERNQYLRGKNAFLRPHMLLTYECKNVLIEDVSFSDPPFWTIVPTFSDNVTIDGITIENPDYSPNTDGIDLSSCTNVHISNSHISVGDDCIVIKSGRDEDGREANRPTENLTITNCTMLKGHGGVVIGSEMSGNVKRVAISNCVFQGTDVGIRIKTMRGRGGIVEDVRVSNVLMYDMVNEGVIITMRYQPTDPETLSIRTPAVRNIQLSGINIRNANRAVAIYGLEEKDVEKVTFTDMEITSESGILLENASDIRFYNIGLKVNKGIPFEAKDTRGIVYDRLTVNEPDTGKPIIKLTNCHTVVVSNSYQPETLTNFLEQDAETGELYFLNNVFPNAGRLYNENKNPVSTQSNILMKTEQTLTKN
ncbi:MAG TPA: glycoside hydrolase family 28 protein [Bacteroidales bacterium]|nr:glycoside hydrolase family 28 protein [Bacteroidales bacterium]